MAEQQPYASTTVPVTADPGELRGVPAPGALLSDRVNAVVG